MLNPAFCGAIMTAAVADYVVGHTGGMPFALGFLVLPLVLHKPTRDILPRSTKTTLAAWALANPAARVGFAERCRSLSSFTREGTLFAANRGYLRFVADGAMVPGTLSLSNKLIEQVPSDEARACLKKAFLVGRWMAGAGSDSTVFMLLGVRP